LTKHFEAIGLLYSLKKNAFGLNEGAPHHSAIFTNRDWWIWRSSSRDVPVPVLLRVWRCSLLSLVRGERKPATGTADWLDLSDENDKPDWNAADQLPQCDV